MTPPLPPWRTDMRRTAAAAQRIEPDDIDAQHALQPLRRDLVDPGRHADDAGIVDQPVETAEGLVDRGKDRGDAGLAADIAFDRDGRTARRPRSPRRPHRRPGGSRHS